MWESRLTKIEKEVKSCLSMRHSVLSRKKPLTDDFHLKVCNALAFAFLTMPLKDDDVVNVAVKDLSTQCKLFLGCCISTSLRASWSKRVDQSSNLHLR